MFQVLTRPPANLKFAQHTTSNCNNFSQSKQSQARSRVQIRSFIIWRTTLLIMFFCGFTLAFSGCGGNVVYGGETGTLVASPGMVTFGSVPIGETAGNTVKLQNTKSTPVEITQLNLSGQSFSLAGASKLPVTIAGGQTLSLNMQFRPIETGTSTGQLTVTSNSSTGGTTVVSLKGTAAVSLTGTGTAARAATSAAALSALSCVDSTVSGAVAEACTVTLSSAAPSGGLLVSLSSGNAVISVPATVTVPYGATSAGFTAQIAAITWYATVSVYAKAGTITKSIGINLQPVVTKTSPTMTIVSSGSPSTYGSAVTLLATISSGPTGTLTFYDGTTSFGTGTINGTTATLTMSSLTAVSHSITASWPGNSNYNAVSSAAITQLVNKATPTITWATPSAIAYGTALSGTQLNATSSVAGAFSYSPAAGAVLTAGSHSITATFTPTDSTDYATATSTVSITANRVTPTITWATPSAIAYGTALSGTQLNATSSVAGAFSYSPAAGAVLTVGSHTITATFTPTDSTDYATATSTVSIAVNNITPTITWATPSAIAYGTALSGTQLDASSTVAGTFAYIPAAGTVLAAGSQTLSVTFTPTDTTSYTTAMQTVMLTVNQGSSTLSINATSLAFGDVLVSTSSTQSVTFSSTGTGSVTVSAATLTGTGFTVSGLTFPLTLTSGQTATLEVQFKPVVASSATGQLTITSNSSTNSTATISLSGTGTASSYSVNLSWDPPTSSTYPVAGYNIYRAPGGSTTYALLNSSTDTATSYVDSTVVSGQSYNYIAQSVYALGAESNPSNLISVSIP